MALIVFLLLDEKVIVSKLHLQRSSFLCQGASDEHSTIEITKRD